VGDLLDGIQPRTEQSAKGHAALLLPASGGSDYSSARREGKLGLARKPAAGVLARRPAAERSAAAGYLLLARIRGASAEIVQAARTCARVSPGAPAMDTEWTHSGRIGQGAARAKCG
jgi:hypothetical protein